MTQNLDVVFSNEDLLVIGPPDSISVDLDLGATGERGSKIFFGNGSPTSYTDFPDGAPILYDVYFNREKTDSDYLHAYQYIHIPGIGNVWEHVLQLFPNESVRKNYPITFEDGQAILPPINIATDLFQSEGNLININEDNISIVYTIENDKPIVSSVQVLTGIINDFFALSLTFNAIEYNEGVWENTSGERTLHLDIRVV